MYTFKIVHAYIVEDPKGFKVEKLMRNVNIVIGSKLIKDIDFLTTRILEKCNTALFDSSFALKL